MTTEGIVYAPALTVIFTPVDKSVGHLTVSRMQVNNGSIVDIISLLFVF